MFAGSSSTLVTTETPDLLQNTITNLSLLQVSECHQSSNHDLNSINHQSTNYTLLSESSLDIESSTLAFGNDNTSHQ